MAKETKNTEKEKFIFIDTCIIEAMNKSDVIKTVTNLSKSHTIVIPSWQLTELQKHFIRRFTGKHKELEQGLTNIRKELSDGFEEESKAFEEYFKTLSDKITAKRKEELGDLLDLLKKQKIITTKADHHYLGERRGREEFVAPYENKVEGDKGYHNRFNDSIFWETLLQSSDDDNGIQLGSTLVIYSKDSVFFENKDPNIINTFLRTEWELLKKGKLELYKEETKPENSEQPTQKDEPIRPVFRTSEIRFVSGQVSRTPNSYEHKASGYLSRMDFLLKEIQQLKSYENKIECFNEIKFYYNEIRRYSDDFEIHNIARRYLDKAEDILDDIPF